MKTTSKVSLFVALSLVLSLFAGCLTGFAATPEVIQVNEYADVGTDHWAYPWVQFMTSEGYIHGYPTAENDGAEVYKPDQKITRAEFVTILYFMLDPSQDMSESFTDLSVDDWYYEYISKAVAAGYLSGYGDGTVKPNAYITREEASSVVYRAFDIAKYEEPTSFADEDEISAWAYEAIMSLAELGVIVGYTGEDESLSKVQPKVNILRAEVASLLANADKFHPAQVKLAADAVTSLDAEGGKVKFDMRPINTSDSLSVSIAVEPETDFTVTYTKNGTEFTVTPDEFAELVFTAEELANANVTLNFASVNDGDTVSVKVVVSDANVEGEDKTVGEKEYTITFGTATPEVTPTPTPAPSTGGGGKINGGTTTKYTVTIILDDNDPIEVSVEAGKTIPTDVLPKPDSADQSYVWHIGDESGEIFDVTQPIRSNVTIVAKTAEILTRDRVVESLMAYQAMKDRADEATVNALSEDEVDTTLTDPYKDGKWWTNDMLAVIVTNDNNKLTDTPAGQTYDNIVGGKALVKTYNDVARYVVDNSSVFAGATITSASKFEYVQYFRAMINTIDKAAVAAVNAYNTELANGGNKDTAMTAFTVAATAAVTDSLAEESLADNDDIKAMAIGYVTALIEKVGGYDALKEKLAGQPTSLDDVTAMLNVTLLYPAN